MNSGKLAELIIDLSMRAAGSSAGSGWPCNFATSSSIAGLHVITHAQMGVVARTGKDGLLGDELALLSAHAVLHPLVQLRARDLCRSQVLHQVVERDASVALQPCLKVATPMSDVGLQEGRVRTKRRNDGMKELTQISDKLVGVQERDIDVATETSSRYGDALRHVEEITRLDAAMLALGRDLVGCRHVLIEHPHGDRNKARVGHPRACFALVV